MPNETGDKTPILKKTVICKEIRGSAKADKGNLLRKNTGYRNTHFFFLDSVKIFCLALQAG